MQIGSDALKLQIRSVGSNGSSDRSNVAYIPVSLQFPARNFKSPLFDTQASCPVVYDLSVNVFRDLA